jgi:hypothetical protein
MDYVIIYKISDTYYKTMDAEPSLMPMLERSQHAFASSTPDMALEFGVLSANQSRNNS